MNAPAPPRNLNAYRQPHDLNKLAASVKVNADAIRKAVAKTHAEQAKAAKVPAAKAAKK